MEWAALISWVLTAGGGFILLTIWLRNGGMSQRAPGEIKPYLILSHFALAATGLVLWIIYVATDSDALAWIAWRKSDLTRAERYFRDSIRILTPLDERAALCESQRGLAQLLASQGKVDEAERYALGARETVGQHDQSSRATTRMALAIVRAAQGRDEEAEELFREALDVVARTEFEYIRFELLTAFSRFLREQGPG